MNRDKTIGHFHLDPKIIHQIGCQSSLIIGQFVFLDNDGLYKPAIATSLITSNVQGIVWGFENEDNFWLKALPGPLKYRFPFGKDYYGVDGNGRVNENNVICSKIPGSVGDRLFLSETIPGAMQIIEPSNYPVIVGTKTQNGMLMRIDINKNCFGII